MPPRRRVPFYWLLINSGGPLLTATILHRGWVDLSRWRVLGVLLLPITTEMAATSSTGWPAFIALNHEVPETVIWAATLSASALALWLFSTLADHACAPAQHHAAGPPSPATGRLTA